MKPETISMIRREVYRRLNPTFDREAVVQDIIAECLGNKCENVSVMFVCNRCKDKLARRQVEQKGLTVISQQTTNESTRDQSVENRDEIERFISFLSPFERKMIWARYFDGQQIREIARNYRVSPSKVCETISVAIFKMHQEITSD